MYMYTILSLAVTSLLPPSPPPSHLFHNPFPSSLPLPSLHHTLIPSRLPSLPCFHCHYLTPSLSPSLSHSLTPSLPPSLPCPLPPSLTAHTCQLLPVGSSVGCVYTYRTQSSTAHTEQRRRDNTTLPATQHHRLLG